MSDDLVKRLRDTPNWKREEYGDYNSAWAHYDRAPFEAANRIEELEAKLAKAVEALDVDLIEQAISDVLLEGGTYRDAAEYAARATLAELKGE